MTDQIATITALCDAGATVETMCQATGLKYGRVYAILREHRPERPRQPRRRTSIVPDKVRALAAVGSEPARIAKLLGVTPAYVYAILKKNG